MCENISEFCSVLNVHAGDEYALRNRAFTWTGDLEAFARMLRKAVEIQTVIPVRTPDERQGMRPEVCRCISQALSEMIQK